MSRKRYLYTMGGQPILDEQGNLSPIEVSDDFTGAERRAQTTTEEIVHGGNRSPEGVDISTRKRRREYMKATGVADHTDFTNHLAKARAERDRFFTGQTQNRERRETLGRALYERKSRR
jgi:hypothetical protein